VTALMTEAMESHLERRIRSLHTSLVP